MGLTMGTGPFGKQPAGTFNFEPDAPKHHALYLEPSPRRVRGVIGGETVVDSTDVAAAARDGPPARLVLPALRRALRPARGDRPHDALPVQGRRELLDDPRRRQARREQGLGLPGDPAGDCPPSRDRVAFYWDAVDHWYEEDEEVFVHPRDPYHRVDLVPSSRTVADLAGRRRAGRVEPPAGLLRDQPADALVPPQGGPRRRPTSRRRAARAAPTRAPRRTGRWAATRTSPGATRTRFRSPRRCAASSRSTTRSSTSTSTASARSAATRPSPGPGATHSDEHHTGDAHGDARAPYRHRSRELPARRPRGRRHRHRRGRGRAHALGARGLPRARRERPGGLHLRRHDERRRRRLDAARRRSAAQPRAHARPLGRLLRRAAARARRARHGADAPDGHDRGQLGRAARDRARGRRHARGRARCRPCPRRATAAAARSCRSGISSARSRRASSRTRARRCR